ncbi:putative 16S rRNA (cytidine(1402)-2'-O)-methyltransferase [Rosa chinensis]|uniref:Putative 16S rRNA (Cytidine(1402)-2'-O)-methyltransferase n=1 Tax=Rosa chinensis TaxID=74649 RepID=A0A2P6PYU0_ROSCH|nr:ribosomal RNA small subunit methyltransferase I [Rosa chinensis]PRQ27105.1 putative 16S rRNA (cytidine(1402)-2'-O)-methyltransferase [Rosa chinensis]
MLARRLPSTAAAFSRRWAGLPNLGRTPSSLQSLPVFPNKITLIAFGSTAAQMSAEHTDSIPQASSKQGALKPGLYLVGTPIGNLEDITFRALRVLKSAHVILSEDTRHSGKLLHHYNIKTPLLSYHKFNESQREQTVLMRLKEGEIVALISDAGMPGISDPGTELAKLCANENIPVIPIPGPSAFVAALSASGLSTDEFTFVGFLSKHSGTRKERLTVSASEATTQIFYVPPHKLLQFLEETSALFGVTRQCVIARELTKIHEEFWRGTLGEAEQWFTTHQPRGEITVLIEGKEDIPVETPSESQLENELRDLISNGHSLSTAVKLVADGTSVKRKIIYSIALRKFGKQQLVSESDSSDPSKPHRE